MLLTLFKIDHLDCVHRFVTLLNIHMCIFFWRASATTITVVYTHARCVRVRVSIRIQKPKINKNDMKMHEFGCMWEHEKNVEDEAQTHTREQLILLIHLLTVIIIACNKRLTEPSHVVDLHCHNSPKKNYLWSVATLNLPFEMTQNMRNAIESVFNWWATKNIRSKCKHLCQFPMKCARFASFSLILFLRKICVSIQSENNNIYFPPFERKIIIFLIFIHKRSWYSLFDMDWAISLFIFSRSPEFVNYN